ncbi:MAG TPA: ABC transporter permease, partial [Bacteroidales bacterium]|nr:ABC transporter permease [Bacteroidales bacterium]
MWKNFFHVAFRNIGKNQVFSMINMAGLTIGLASAIIIILFISMEVSYDRFHERSDDIYRTYLDGKIGDQTFRGAWSSYVLGPAAQKEIDEIEEYVRLEVFPQQLIWNGDERQIEDNVIFADSTFFRVFSFKLIHGNPDNVLSNPNSVVITRNKALQYFGTENPIGKTLEFNSNENYYVVTGVMEEFPENSHFFCDFLLSMSNIEASRSENWLSNSIYTYFLLEQDTDYRDVEEKINQLLLKNIKPELEELLD